MTTLAQPLAQPTIQPTKQSKTSKPTKSLEKLLIAYFSKPYYGKDGKIRRVAPKIIVKALKDIDAKSLKNGYQEKLKALQEKKDALPLTDAQGRTDIDKQIESLKKEQDRLYENLINISSFDFVKEFERCNGDVNQILDPELRGYITILGDKINKETFKKLIDKFKFAKVENKDYAKILKDMLNNNKYKMKIFNASFTHPDMKNKQGQAIPRKIKAKDAKGDETMKLYLKRFCKYFDWVFEQLVKGTDANQIIISAMNNYASEQAAKEKTAKVKHYSNINIQDVWNKAIAPKQPGEKPKYDKATRELIGIYHSVKSMIDELKEYPNLNTEYQKYITRLQQFEQIKAIQLRTGDNITLLQSFCQIVKSCETLQIDKFPEMVFDDFMHASDMKLKPEVKKRLRECALAGQMIQQVEQQFETKQLKVKDKETGEFKTKQVASDMKLAANQFLKEDINVLESVETMYDTDKYDRIGKFGDFKASKAWRVALALRLLKEVKYVIAEGQAKGQNQFVFAL